MCLCVCVGGGGGRDSKEFDYFRMWDYPILEMRLVCFFCAFKRETKKHASTEK